MVTIRKAYRKDTQAIFDLRKKAILKQCVSHYTLEQLAVWTSGSPSLKFMADVEEGFYVAVANNQIVATGMLNVESRMIDGIFVDPDFSGQGYGKAMLQYLEQLAIESSLDEIMLDSTLNAAGFYHAYGFIGEEVSTYHSPKGITLACIPMKKTVIRN